MCDFSKGNNLKAYQGFLAALRVDPNNAQSLHMLSEACIRLGASELAASYSRAALAVDPEIKAALFVQIEAAARQNDLDKANTLMRTLPSESADQFMHAMITQRLALAANEFEAPLVDLANIIESTGKQELARELFAIGFSRFLDEKHQERYKDFIEALGLHFPPKLSFDIESSLSEPATKTIDIIIPIHNSVCDLAECLSSLRRHSDPALRRLILVDDASDGITNAWLNQYVAKNPDTILLRNAENLGFTRSVIVGIEQSDAPYFVLLNSDTIVSSGWMAGLWRGLAIDDTHAMAGPLSNRAYFQSIGPIDDAGLRPNRRMIDKRAAFISANGLATYPKVPFLSGFCLMIRRDHFDAVGGLDAESYPRGYFEVQDLALRMVDCNLYPCLVDDVYVHHSQSASIEAKQRDPLILKGFRQICMRHGAIRVLAAEEVCRHLPEVGRQRRALDAFSRPNESQQLKAQMVCAAPAFSWLVAPLPEMISPSTEVCLFVAHAPYGQLADFTADYLQDLRRSGFCVVVCLAVNDINAAVGCGWSKNADAVLLRENRGYDFGAWADVLRLLPQLWTVQRLLFANDSVVGPFQPLTKIVARIRDEDAGFFALTDCTLFQYHAQSFFFGWAGRNLSSAPLRAFWNDVENLANKADVIQKYEIPLLGLSEDLPDPSHQILFGIHGIFGPLAEMLPPFSAAHHSWQALVKSGMPFVKTALLSSAAASLEEVCAATGADKAKLQRHIEQKRIDQMQSGVPKARFSGVRDARKLALDNFLRQQKELCTFSAPKLIANLAHQPLVSIIMRVYDAPVRCLRRSVESLQEQYYGHWELCAVVDFSTSDALRNLIKEMAKDDPRIRVTKMTPESGVSDSLNHALAMVTGAFVTLVGENDEITPDALLRIIVAINDHPEADFLYSDECRIDDTPTRGLFDFALKPDWSPEIMLNFMVTGNLSVYRTALLRQVNGFRQTYDFSHNYDVALRMSEVARSVVHVERILYLQRALECIAPECRKNSTHEMNRSVLADALERRGIPATVEIESHANRVQMILPETGVRVSIIIPSDSVENLRLALDALRYGSDYNDYEVRVVCNSAVADELELDYHDWAPANFVRYDKLYNFSDKCNTGAVSAEGDIVVFYNDDVYPIGRDWIERLIELLWIPGVGAVSPQLLYQNGTIQYAGMISGVPGLIGTAFHGFPSGHTDEYLSMNRLVRNISVLSGACCAIRRDLFLQIGGFDAENTPDGHSDFDLSCKIRDAGYRCVYTPYSLLNHIGNGSWNVHKKKQKADIFCLKRWGRYISRDPYFTNSMRQTLYSDFPYDYHIYAEYIDPSTEYTGPDVLFVSHELTHTGAPHMLLVAARAVKEAGGFPVVVSPTDGPLRSTLVEAGIAVIIDASVSMNHFLFERFARNFDLAVVNTSSLRHVVEQLAAISGLPLLWWLHESKALANTLNDVAPIVWERAQAICVSSYAQSYLPKGIQSRILFNGLPDYSKQIIPMDAIFAREKLVFLVLGTIEPRKGQDIFVAAILGLPEVVRSHCRFIIAGKIWPEFEMFSSKIFDVMKYSPEIEYAGDVTAKEALSLIADCDILVSCSRDDAFPLVVIESALMSKPTIMSDHVGAREVFGKTCSFSFPSDDADALRDRILEAYENADRLVSMGHAARQTYEEKLTEAEFASNFMSLVNLELLRRP